MRNTTFSDLKILVKENPWVLALIAIALYSLASVCYNSVSVIEAQTLLSGKLIFTGMGFSKHSLIPASPLAPMILGLGDALLGITGARIIAVLFSLITALFFYKFAHHLLKDVTSAFFSTIVFVSASSFLFIGKTASFEIISLTFFVVFLNFAQRRLEFTQSNYKDDILLSVFLFLAVSTNYLLFVFVLFFVLGVLISSRRKSFYTPLIIFTVLIIGCIIAFPSAFTKFYGIFTDPKPMVPFIRQVTSLLQYIIIPLIFLTAMFSDRYRYPITNKKYYTFFGLAVLMIVAQLIIGDYSTIGRNITFAVLFLSPLTGIVLKDYLQRHGTTKMTVIVVLFAVMFLSFYKVRMLEDSYPNMKKASVLLKENAGLNSFIIAENPIIVQYYLFPKVLLNQYAEIKAPKGLEADRLYNRSIIDAVMNGKADLIVINELVNSDLTDRIKEAISTKYYRTLYTEEYKISSTIYPNSEGNIIIYKLK